MPAIDEVLPLTVDERCRYLARQTPRYRRAGRAERSQLLTEMQQYTGLHRQSLLRLLNGPTLARQPRRSKRPPRYGGAVTEVLRIVWESLDYVCAERLPPALLATAQHLARFGELRRTPDLEVQLGQLSRATVQRRLATLRQDTPRLPRRGPAPANRLARDIPTGRLPWDLAEPGHFEVDLVHQGGETSAGDYVHTLQLVDVATGWSERVAVLGRSQRAMEEGFRHVLARLPCLIKHLHPDNGSEFLNDHLIRFWGAEIVGLSLSRSRPYRKNDNRFVEQQNDTLVRAYFGPARLDTPAQCAAMNALYDHMWVYYNLFQPVLRLAAKEVTAGRLKRTWDTAKTPYARLRASGVLAPAQEVLLGIMHTTTNPRQLRQRSYAALEQLWELPRMADLLRRGAAAAATTTAESTPAGSDVAERSVLAR